MTLPLPHVEAISLEFGPLACKVPKLLNINACPLPLAVTVTVEDSSIWNRPLLILIPLPLPSAIRVVSLAKVTSPFPLTFTTLPRPVVLAVNLFAPFGLIFPPDDNIASPSTVEIKTSSSLLISCEVFRSLIRFRVPL